MNGKTVESFIRTEIFFHSHFYSNLVYGQFARTTRNLRKCDDYCAFNLYVDGEYMQLADNVRIMQRTSEISLRHFCNSNRSVTGSLIVAQVQHTFSGIAGKPW